MAEAPTPQEAEIIKIIPLYTYATIEHIMRHLGMDYRSENQQRNTQQWSAFRAEAVAFYGIERE